MVANIDKLFEPNVMIFMIPIVAIIACYWHKTAKVNSDNELKRDMLERGMSAEEIERVIDAGTNNEDKDD